MTESFAVCERDVDFLILEELQCNPRFRRWMLDQLGTRSDASTDIVRLVRSVATFRGETDLLFIHPDFDGVSRAVMIENKIDALFTRDQAKRYQARGEDGVRRGEWVRFVVALIGPRTRLQAEDAAPFDNRISYEEAAEQLGGEGERLAFKRSILLGACAIATVPKVPEVDPETSQWFKEARELAAVEFPDLPLPLERGRAAANTWLTFSLKGFAPSRLVIEIKPAMGAVDLRLRGVEVGDLRRNLKDLVVLPMDTVAANKSCAIRLTFPRADVRRAFAGQESMLRPMFEGAQRFMHLSLDNRQTIEELLDS